ncbi:hypothetical protein [Winogradskyella aurantiaca]|uniref:hypothetical protein n=1 Tax=Winogradskyella aurantiaca TaxID=2219558 RepID=UPI000E1CA327|nr:hypothetical protein [Winogradskyella aurantiaca]
MGLKNIQECERNKIERWAAFQLEHKWKRFGILLSVLCLVLLMLLKLMDLNTLESSFVLKRVLLIGLLVISLSKDKEEDEMIVSLRAKSFTLAFVLAVVYSLVQPLVNVLVFYLIKGDMTDSFSYFQVLSFMLMLQIMFFEVLKRNR